MVAEPDPIPSEKRLHKEQIIERIDEPENQMMQEVIRQLVETTKIIDEIQQ